MSASRVFVVGAGIVSALGQGLAATEASLRQGHSCLKPLDLFVLQEGRQLPAGQAVFPSDEADPLPRSHRLALCVASQALAGQDKPPDAVILGCTTGGMLRTENLLEKRQATAGSCRYHGLGTVTEAVARLAGCSGPALTVSTACSSGAVALALALRLLRSGGARRVLAGGVDSLCRLTFFGFHSLQLVDAAGPRPLDRQRRGMAVAEGAAMLLLSCEEEENPLAELCGAGLSCDAHHPTSPHPQGDGALAAMGAALADAGLAPEDIDYINLHGTGTPDNDLAEARAIHRLLSQPPPLSSIKGASGHSLAASGAIEAVVAVLALQKGLVPANTGFSEEDPALALIPQRLPGERALRTVLSNSFGFGGNNGSLVLAAPNFLPARPRESALPPLAVHGAACLTAAGDLSATLQALEAGRRCLGRVDEEVCCRQLDPRRIRRLKRLPRLALALAKAALAEQEASVDTVFLGTGWGGLTETADFLDQLTKSEQRFPSPTDFIASVHNAPAGQVALLLGAKGANITTSGGEHSFEQACFAAQLLACRDGRDALLLGADEAHAWTPLLDAAAASGLPPADGGGALWLKRSGPASMAIIRHCALFSGQEAVPQLVAALGGADALRTRIGLIAAGLAPGDTALAQAQLEQVRRLCDPDCGLWLYRDWLGAFASASAVAAALAAVFVQARRVPAALSGGDRPLFLEGRSVLLLGCGPTLSAVEFASP